ncbi:MAG: hypothetical protein ACI8PZ_006942, partial [Myxococcota bacterium]
HPPGAVIEDAIVVDVTNDGLAAVGDMALAIVPARIELPGIASGETDWVCFTDSYFGIFGGFVDISVTQLNILPSADGVLRAEVDLELSVNNPDEPMLVEYDAFCFEGACDAWVEPFPLSATADLVFVEVADETGTYHLSPQIQNVVIDYAVGDDDLGLQDCSLDTLLDIAGFFGISVTDLLLQQVDTLIADLQGQIDSINADLVGTLSAVDINESVDLLDGVTLDLAIALGDVTMDDGGLRLHIDGGAGTERAAECVKPYDPGESLATPSDPPGVGEVPLLADGVPHVGAYISDDFANQALYAVWQTGLLCQNIDADLIGDSVPIPFDTSLLPLLVGDAFQDFFPETQPIVIETRPEDPPRLDLSQGDLAIALDDFGLVVLTEVAGRKVRLVDSRLDLEIGLALGFDGETGLLDVGIDLSRGASAEVMYNEYAPGRNADIEASLASLLQQPLITGVVDSLLADLAFGLPSIPFGVELYGLQSMEISPAGPEEDWAGAYAFVGPVPYETAEGGCGCDDSSGCGADAGGCDPNELFDTAGCDAADPLGTQDCGGCDEGTGTGTGEDCGGGCSISGRLSGRLMVVTFALMVAFRRRRN